MRLSGCGIRRGKPLQNIRASRLYEERIAREDFERFDGAFGGDDRAELDAAFAVNLPRQWRIGRLNANYELGHLHTFADDTSLGFFRVRLGGLRNGMSARRQNTIGN